MPGPHLCRRGKSSQETTPEKRDIRRTGKQWYPPIDHYVCQGKDTTANSDGPSRDIVAWRRYPCVGNGGQPLGAGTSMDTSGVPTGQQTRAKSQISLFVGMAASKGSLRSPSLIPLAPREGKPGKTQGKEVPCTEPRLMLKGPYRAWHLSWK